MIATLILEGRNPTLFNAIFVFGFAGGTADAKAGRLLLDSGVQSADISLHLDHVV